MHLVKPAAVFGLAAALVIPGSGARAGGLFNRDSNGDFIGACQGGTEPGSGCTVDGDCAGGGTCDPTTLFDFTSSLDNPGVLKVQHEFEDELNQSSMFAFLDDEGLNFAAGRAVDSSSIPEFPSNARLRMTFEWVTTDPDELRNRDDNAKLKQNMNVAIRLVAERIVEIPNQSDPEVTEMFTLGDEMDPDLPVQTEDCQARVRVKSNEEYPDALEAGDFTDLILRGRWKLNCKPLGLSDQQTTYFPGTEFEITTSEIDLVERFTNRRNQVKARGEGTSEYCDEDRFIGPLPAECGP